MKYLNEKVIVYLTEDVLFHGKIIRVPDGMFPMYVMDTCDGERIMFVNFLYIYLRGDQATSLLEPNT